MGSNKTPKSGNKAKADDAWRTLIETTKLNDGEFNLKLIMLEAAGTDQDLMYLSKFESFAQNEKRFVIKNITKPETIFMINQLGTEKKERNEELRVFEEAYEALKQDKTGFPSEIAALVIKHQVMDMKHKYIEVQKQKQELKEGMKQESVTMIDRSEVKGTIVKPPEPVELPKANKKGKKELSSEIIAPKEGKKYNTLLREHGEEWRDKVYVDDYPVDGPNLYVALTGFTDPLLPSKLISIGIPLVAVVQIRVDPLYAKIPSSLTRASKRGQRKTDVLAEQASKFWADIQNLRISPDVADEYKDIAFISFKPPYWEGDKLKGDPETIYDEISFLLYDIQDLCRQHANYLNNMDIIHVTKEALESSYFDRYTRCIDRIPNECITLFVLLDGILNAVDDNYEEDQSSSLRYINAGSKTITSHSMATATSDAKERHRVEKSLNLVEEVFHSLQVSHEEEVKKNKHYQKKYCNFSNPVVIDYGDYSSLISFHIISSGLNFQKIMKSMLLNMPLNRLWNTITKPSGENEARINYHINVLLHSFDRKDVEISDLFRLIYILAFRKLYNNRSSNAKTDILQTELTDFKKTYLKRSELSEPLHKMNSFLQMSESTISTSTSIYEISQCEYSDTSTKDSSPLSTSMLFECPDISGLISAAELASSKAPDHAIDDFEYFENFYLKCSLQVLHKVFTEYNCVNYKYCRVTDSILLLFYNSHNEEGIFTKEWRTDLTTPLCMQDFFDYIIDENYDWLQMEEKNYDNVIKENILKEHLDDLKSISNRSCIDKSNLEIEMLIEGSLKYEELLKVETTPIPSETTIKTKSSPGKKKTNVPTSSADLAKSKKKTPTESVKSTKTFSSTNRTSSEFSLSSVQDTKRKQFLGYDLGDRRLEMFGRDACFFSKDGSKVISKYFMTFPHNQEHVTLNFISGNKNNEWYVHRALGIYTKPIFADSVRIITKNDVQINLLKFTYEIIPPSNFSQSPTESSKKPSPRNTMEKLSTDEVPTKECYFPFVISCPNGLVVESIHKNKSSSVSHIRQFYLKTILTGPGLDIEEKRCISKSGEVIIFKENGDIEMLFPDSSYILCTKYENKLIETESYISEPVLSFNTESNKNKKVSKIKANKEVKEKGKKTREPVVIPSLIEIEIKKEPIYDLCFTEYLIIEADGKKKYFSEDHFELKEILLIRTATDFCLGEVFSRRMDGTNILYSKEGTLTVTFPNRTRIVSSFYIEENEVFPEWTEEEYVLYDICKPSRNEFEESTNRSTKSSNSDENNEKTTEEEFIQKYHEEGYISVQLLFTVEHTDYATVTVDTSNREFTIDMPNLVSMNINDLSHYKIKFDCMTSSTFDSKCFHIEYKSCQKCDSRTICDINMPNEAHEENDSAKWEWLSLTDSYGKHVSVNNEGVLTMDEDESSEKEMDEENRESEDRAQKKSPESLSSQNSLHTCDCKEIHQSDMFRFFVLHRDLSVSELVHKLIIEDYKKNCLQQPWCSVSDYDVFGDNRKLISTLSPIDRNESDKWLMDSKFMGKPINLVFKDLRSEDGKGFYKWMRPYGRFQPEPRRPPPAVETGLPKALVLRTLEQQWSREDPEILRGGRELFAAIIKYRKIMVEDKETMTGDPIRDNRSKIEVDNFQRVQELAQRTIEKMLKKMDLHKQATGGDAKPLEIIRIPLRHDEESATIHGEMTTVSVETTRSSFETALTGEELVKELEQVAPMSPQLARYWRIRAEEKKEEEFYKEVLRQGTVPPYFDNVLGGAVWWDVNHTAEEAVVLAEFSKLPQCCCVEPEVSCFVTEEEKAGE